MSIKTNKITRLYDFKEKTTARSSEVDAEFNQLIDVVSDVVDDLTLNNDMIGENSNEISSIDAKADAAVAASTLAVETADGAVLTAEGAVTTAGNAVITAGNAVTTANSAVTVAEGAVTTAESAVTTAESAVDSANAAQITADNAVTSAQAAQSAAEDAAADAQEAADAVAGKADVAYVDQVAENFVLGALPNGSVTDDKLSNTAGQVKDRLSSAESDISALDGRVSTNEGALINVNSFLMALNSEVIPSLGAEIMQIHLRMAYSQRW